MSRSARTPSVYVLLKKRLESLGGFTFHALVTIKSPKKLPKALPDAVVVEENEASQVAEFKVPPPSRKRKLIVEFLEGYGSADTPSYKLWPEVDHLWVPPSRERKEVMVLVAATVENVYEAWKVSFSQLPLCCALFYHVNF